MKELKKDERDELDDHWEILKFSTKSGCENIGKKKDKKTKEVDKHLSFKVLLNIKKDAKINFWNPKWVPL